MSVPVEKRSQTELEFITRAKKIAYVTNLLTMKYPTRQFQSIGKYMNEAATLALRNLQLVYGIYLRTDADLLREYQLLDEALAYIAHLEVLLDISIRVFDQVNADINAEQRRELLMMEADPEYRPKRFKRKGPTEKEIEQIAIMIEPERELIAGVKRKAPKLLAEYKERRKKREIADGEAGTGVTPVDMPGAG